MLGFYNRIASLCSVRSAQNTRSLPNQVSKFGSLSWARQKLVAQTSRSIGRTSKQANQLPILAWRGNIVISKRSKQPLTFHSIREAFVKTTSPVNSVSLSQLQQTLVRIHDKLALSQKRYHHSRILHYRRIWLQR